MIECFNIYSIIYSLKV